MWIIMIIAFVFVYFISLTFQIVVQNPIKTLYNGVIDIYEYIIHKKYNEAKLGQIRAYVGLFGKGKTLSAVHDVISYYKKYNDKLVWDQKQKKFITQKVIILSNVPLVGVPYIYWTSMRQIVDIAENHLKVDEETDTRTIYIALGDEFSVQMNSRQYRNNIDPLFLNTLLTCRHSNFGPFYLTAQRFTHMDALLRQVTSVVIDCDKLWRIQRHYFYDAWEYENATKKSEIKAMAHKLFCIICIIVCICHKEAATGHCFDF